MKQFKDTGMIQRRMQNTMANHYNARQLINLQPITESVIATVLHAVLPSRNNFGFINYSELLTELLHFGISKRYQLRRLMLRHRRELTCIDQEALDKLHVRIYRKEFGDTKFNDLIRHQRWFSWEALTRFALELEFRDKYREFADKRDAPPAL